MRLLADTQAVHGLHANPITIRRVETCLENLRAAAVVLPDFPLTDSDDDVLGDAPRLLNRLRYKLLGYDDELKAA